MGTLRDAVKGIANKQKNKSEKPDDNWHWEKADLGKLEKNLERTVKIEENGAKYGGKSLKGENVSKEHYKENLKYDKRGLERVRQEIKNRKLIKTLKEKKQKAVNDAKYKRRDIVDEYIED